MLLTISDMETWPAEAVAPRLLAEPENQWFDRKSARIQASALAETLVAMANAEGGMIAVGLSDGLCEGIGGQRRRQNEWLRAGIDLTNPPVRFDPHPLDCVNQRGAPDQLLLLVIPPSEQVHTTTKDDVYLRVGGASRKLSFEQRIQLRYDKGDTGFERTPAQTYGEAKLDFNAVTEYAALVRHPDPDRLLQARDLVGGDGTLFIGGQLLFGLEPQRTHPQAYVRVLKYAGVERRTGTEQNLVSDLRCEGTLPQQLDAARQAVTEILPARKALRTNGKFGWSSLVPEDVWLEALVNAVLHRAYSNFGDHIRLTVFDDRVEVFSPGRFPGIASPEDLTQVQRFSRNPRIARVMADLSYGQEMGEGLRRMVAGMESTGRQRPVVTQTAGGVTVTLLGRVD